jgi:hypothetical protein
MSTQPLPNNQPVPKILNRQDVIVESANIICKCGRPKSRPHCPKCGSVQTRAKASTSPVKLDNGDVILGCNSFRCIICNTKFNDVDWYFNCHVAPKPDIAATKAKQESDRQGKLFEAWMIRVKSGERFTYNDNTQCKSETGRTIEHIRDMLRQNQEIARLKAKEVQFLSQAQQLDKLIAQKKNQIALHENRLPQLTDPEEINEEKLAIEFLTERLREFEDLRLKESD